MDYDQTIQDPSRLTFLTTFPPTCTQDESEDYLSLMWHKVAMCSKDQIEQLASYQNAIEALQVRIKADKMVV